MLFASHAWAGAFYLQEQSVRGAGRAYSGEVADQGTASLWWNPAAIASVKDKEIYVGANAVLVKSRLDDAGSTLTRPAIAGGATVAVGGPSRVSDPVEDGVVPNFASAYRLNDRLVLGLSVGAPFNFTNKPDTGSWNRYDNLKSKLTTADVQGTLAYSLTDQLDVGLGLSARYTNAELSTALPNLSSALPDGLSTLKGDGTWDFGWSLGAQYHPSKRLTLGGSYRSAIKNKIDGRIEVTGLLGPLASSNVSADGVGKVTMPWIATLGARWAVNDRLTANVSVTRTGWSKWDEIVIDYAGHESISEQDYKDTTNVALGVDYALTSKLTLRGGVQYDPTPTPDVGRSTRIPDNDRMHYAVGASAQLRQGLMLDLAASYAHSKDGTIVRDETIYPGTAVATTLKTRANATGSAVVLSTGLRWSF